MADITKCSNRKCPIKDLCKRWVVKSNPYKQSMAHFNFRYDKGKVVCEYFMSNK